MGDGSFVHRVPFDNPVNLKNGDTLQVTVDVFCKDNEVTVTNLNVFFQPIEGGAQIIEMSLAGHELDHTGMSEPDKELMAKLGQSMAENIDKQVMAVMHPGVADELLGDPLSQSLVGKQMRIARDLPGEGWDEI
jgi:hypothetical protein